MRLLRTILGLPYSGIPAGMAGLRAKMRITERQQGYCRGNAGCARVDKTDYFRKRSKPIRTILAQACMIAIKIRNATMRIRIAAMSI
jgi:hypothetical protein